MKRLLCTTTIVFGALYFGAPAANAVPQSLVAFGITYTLTETSVTNSGKTGNFTLTISGENTASDQEGGVNAGRSGINAIAFNQPNGGTVTGGTVTAPPNFTFISGGLNSGGCDTHGNFFCFDNTAIPPIPGGSLSGTLTFNFSATSDTAGVWPGYQTDFKIDWVGTKNNYDLVSLGIPVNTPDGVNQPPPPPPPGVPEPASLALLGVGLLGTVALSRRKRQA